MNPTQTLGKLMDRMLAQAEEAHNASPANGERRDAFYEAAAMVREAMSPPSPRQEGE